MATDFIFPDIPVVTRKEAKERGLKRYFTGKPCPKGHVDYRHTSNGSCSECGRHKALHRMRTNPAARAKSRDAQKRRYHTDPEYNERVKNRAKQWVEDNPERAKKNRREKHLRNRDDNLAAMRDRYQENRKNPDWVEKEQARCRQKNKENPDHRRAAEANMRARRYGVEGTLKSSVIQTKLKAQNFKCTYCEADIRAAYELDHIIPMSRGGANLPDNVQCLCAQCNRRKSCRMPEVFSEDMGRL